MRSDDGGRLQKREIAAESLEPGASPIIVARRHCIGTGLAAAVAGRIAGGRASREPRPRRWSLGQAPADGQPEPGASAPGLPSRPDGMIEIVLPNGGAHCHGVVEHASEGSGYLCQRAGTALHRRLG